MKFLLIPILAVAAFMPMAAQADTLDDAHRAFASCDYQRAADGYQAVLTQKGYSAPVLFDLGNSLYRQGDFAHAILAYKRAEWLAPNERDITTNLLAAQKQAGLHCEKAPLVFARLFSASGWAWMACGAWTLTCLCVLARKIWPQRRILFSAAGAIAALVLAIAITGAAMLAPTLHQAIVLDKNAAAVISPFPGAQTVFSPAAGETVAIQETYHGFVRVKDSAGHTGWIEQKQVESIIPPAARG